MDLLKNYRNTKLLIAILIFLSLCVSGAILYMFRTEAAVPPRAYFVDSTLGNDSNSGLDQNRPWKTLTKVNSFPFNPGDKIFFKRGSIWHDRLIVSSSGTADSYIIYSAYGTGPNPKITGAVEKNFQWMQIRPNVWKTSFDFVAGEAANGYGNIGNVLFNNRQLVAVERFTEAELKNQGDFYFSRTSREVNKINGFVELYSTKNPSSYYSKIEMVPGSDGVFARNKSFFRVSNLDISAYGVHGINVAFSSNFNISNNQISFIGGSEQENGCPTCTGHTRLGNGIQISGCKNALIEKNSINQVFDGGISAEYSSTTTPVAVQDYRIRENVISNADMGLAFWIRPEGSKAKNILFENNKVFDSGKGWGNDSQRVDMIRARADNGSRGVSVMLSYSSATEKSVAIKNNTFSNPLKTNIRISNRDLSWIDLNNNTYINATGNLSHLDLTNYKSDFSIGESSVWKSQTSKDTYSLFNAN